MHTITLIGAGNVGYHLGHRLVEIGCTVPQVFSRRMEKARELATLLGAAPVNRLDGILPEADLYILAVADGAIGHVAQELSRILPAEKAVVHCSGATPSTVLAPFFPRHGVFYPLQTFSRSREPDFSRIPICVYSPEAGLREALLELGRLAGAMAYEADDAQREALHVAAVFANNFSNYLFHVAHEILTQEKLPFSLLQPLILETALKVQEHPPREMQTGPARRGDRATIERHLEYLQQYPKLAAIYEMLSKAIQEE